MMNEDDLRATMVRRIAERLEALDLSERKASMDATGQPDAIRFIRTRGTMPSAARLMKIGRVLQATPEYLTGTADINNWEADQDLIRLASTMNDDADRQFRSGRSVPVMGSVAFSDDGPVEREKVSVDMVIYKLTPEVLAFAAAPLGTKVGRLGAFYPADTTMSPVFEPNIPAVFVHGEEAGVGDYALLFIRASHEAGKQESPFFILRRLVDRGEGWLTIEQHNPSSRRKLSAADVSHTRKVLSLKDYVAPQE